MGNPFIYNSIVTGKDFCGRNNYIQEMVRKINNNINILLFSKRRYGKTSLLKEIFRSYLPKETMKIYIDLFSITDEIDFAKQVSIGVANSDYHKSIAVRIKELGNILRTLRLSVATDSTGSISITPAFGSGRFDFLTWFNDTFDNLAAFLEKKNMKGCIVFDEFQQISTVKEHNLESLLRGKIQEQRNISYIFTGSKQHILANMFVDTNRPFYTLADIIELLPINEHEFYDFVLPRFRSENMNISEKSFQFIYQLSFGETRFVQKMCHYLYETKSKEINDELISTILQDITRNNDNFYRNYFSNNFTAAQRKVLLILSQGYDKIFSRLIASRYDISTGTLQTALKALEEKLTIYKDDNQYRIYDVEFYHWLQTTINAE